MSGRRHALRRLRHAHHVAATVLLNSLGMILAVSVALAVIFWMKDRRGYVDELYDALDHAQVAALFPGRSRAEVSRIWLDVVQPLAYQPFTEFRERPRRTPFVHVDEAGFRHVASQGPWPPDPARTNVFVFGGSTTFGYGVADDDTIPSRLQPLLQARRRDVAVYNFGRGFYYSTQERILFEQLLLAGHVPHLAIFVDGLNDFCFDRNDSSISPQLAAAFERGARVSFVDWMGGTPLGRAAAYAQNRLRADRDAAGTRAELAEDAIRRLIERYLANKRLIEAASAAYGVTAVFVWQPVPMYRYDPQFHFFARRGFSGLTRVRGAYERMATFVRDHPVGGHFVWLADVQETSREPLYIDVVHYAPPFAARLATLIDERVGPLVLADDRHDRE